MPTLSLDPFPSDHNAFTDPGALSHIVDSAILTSGSEVASSFRDNSVRVSGLIIPGDGGGVIRRSFASPSVFELTGEGRSVRAIGVAAR